MSGSAPFDLSIYENKVRVRACGLLEINKKILLLKHNNIGSAGYLWAPPGGGVDFGVSVEETLKREFKEETDLEIGIRRFLFVNEFIGSKYHAIELFYEVVKTGGNLKLGSDPELSPENQILQSASFFSYDDIKKMKKEVVHSAFNEVESPEKVFDLKGLISFKD